MQHPQENDSRASSQRKGAIGWGRDGRSHESRPLSLREQYPCPICQYGHLTEMVLMDAFGCDFCRHIFAAQIPEQQVQVLDSAQPISWRWNGRRWQPLVATDANATIALWIIAGVLVVVPATLVGLAVYLFPPLPGSRWGWFPEVWAIATLVLHGTLVGWLLAEYYQLPFYVTSKFWVQQWLRPRQS